MAVLAALCCSVLVSPGVAWAASNGGGVTMQGACDNQYPGQRTVAAALDSHSAYSWRCTKGSDKSRGVDVGKQCTAQYGAGMQAIAQDPRSAYSWVCKPTTAPPAAAPSTPAAFCECVIYVQKYIGHINTYYAKDSGPGLVEKGYHKVTEPVAGDIVVMQGGFRGANWTAGTAGHIAFLASYSSVGGKTTVVFRGTNQGTQRMTTDHGCNNVTQQPITYTSGQAGITFYRK